MGYYKREWLLAVRNWASFINPIAFYLIVLSLFPMAITFEADQLKDLAPGLIWVTILLSIIIGLPSLFQSDYEDGTLEQWLLSTTSPIRLVLARLSVHWLWIIAPILVLCPISAQFFNMSGYEVRVLMLSILLGSPTIILVGAVVSALLLGSRHASVILGILVLPLMIPIIIFSVGMIHAISISAVVALLLMMLALSLTLAPFAVVAALRIS